MAKGKGINKATQLTYQLIVHDHGFDVLSKEFAMALEKEHRRLLRLPADKVVE